MEFHSLYTLTYDFSKDMCLAYAIISIVTELNTCNDTTSLHNDNQIHRSSII